MLDILIYFFDIPKLTLDMMDTSKLDFKMLNLNVMVQLSCVMVRKCAQIAAVKNQVTSGNNIDKIFSQDLSLRQINSCTPVHPGIQSDS